MKKLIILLSLFLLTGCNLKYEIYFKDGIHENIDIIFMDDIYKIASSLDGDGFYLEKELVENDIPSLINYKDYYNKSIINNKNVKLDYNYTYDNFNESYIINRCFENVSIKNDDKQLYIHLSGNFKCFDNKKFDISIKSDYKVLNHNANKFKNNNYIWNINTNEEVDVLLHISKEKINNIEFKYIYQIILLIVLIVMGFVVYKVKTI
ncbi:MAG: hypothetical protein IJZ36_05455 [Bacilli bacterium]|nr:hypothetical protein [Bacilli bacterium]